MRNSSIRAIALVLAMAAMPAFARAPAAPPAPLETVMSLQVSGEVDIDASGNVVAFRFEAPPPDSVRPAIERTIRGWHFVPRIDGAVVQAQTLSMLMSLSARETGGKYLSKVENVALSAKATKPSRTAENEAVTLRADVLRPPMYPQGLFELGISGKVLVGLLIDAKGRVASATVVQSALMDAQDQSEGARRALKYFEEASLDAAHRWRFEVTRGAGVPTPGDMTVLVPVNYAMGRKEPTGRWRSIVRTTRTPPPWLPAADDRTRIGVADVGEQGTVPDAADVRLAVDQAGVVL
jgi:TonB family protein